MIVMAVMRTCHMRIIIIEAMRWIITRMAIMVMGDVSLHIRLVMGDIHCFGTGVITWPCAIVIRRHPHCVVGISIHIPHKWSFDESRSYNIVISVKITISHHFHIEC